MSVAGPTVLTSTPNDRFLKNSSCKLIFKSKEMITTTTDMKIHRRKYRLLGPRFWEQKNRYFLVYTGARAANISYINQKFRQRKQALKWKFVKERVM